MLMKIVFPLLTAVVLAGSVSAQAATNRDEKGDMRFSEYQHCKNLATKFDSYVANHSDAKNLARAKELRTQGMQACDNYDFMYGTHSLEQALLDVGITPPSAHFM